MAARKLGLTEAPVIVVEGMVRKVPGSNPGGPTKFLKDLLTRGSTVWRRPTRLINGVESSRCMGSGETAPRTITTPHRMADRRIRDSGRGDRIYDAGRSSTCSEPARPALMFNQSSVCVLTPDIERQCLLF